MPQHYFLIESRDPFDTTTADSSATLARQLVADGHTVTLFLVQNGVLPTRPSAKSKHLADAAKAGVTILADDFSLRERGIAQDRLLAGIKPASIDAVVDAMAAGAKTIWH